MLLDFIVRRAYYWDHIKPIWDALPEGRRGSVWMPEEIFDAIKSRSPDVDLYYQPFIERHTNDQGIEEGGGCGDNPILAAAYGDGVRAADANTKRPTILIEHGAGLTFGKAEYADGTGQRYKFSLMPVQSQYILNKVNRELLKIPHPIVGVPKLDKWANEFNQDHPIPIQPTIAIAFHHGNKNSRPAEIGSAWEYYVDFLPVLAQRYKLILHTHPLMMEWLADWDKLQEAGVEYVADFEEVMSRADVYVNDASSTLYEFCVTGKPVIILNAPWFNKLSKFGLRFWDYTDIGLQVEAPEQLLPAIERTLTNPDEFKPFRSRAIHDLFPYLGKSTTKMIAAIDELIYKNVPPPKYMKKVEHIPQDPSPMTIVTPKEIRPSTTRGIMYMAFGANAWREMDKSIRSLRATGCDLPVAAVGDSLPAALKDQISFVQWAGASPFNEQEHRTTFQFQAAIIKSALYRLTPFTETMYVDCDTEFLKDPETGFNHLRHWDFCIAQEPMAVNELYNEPNPRHWEHDLPERDLTVKEMGGDGNFPMINSGVFFWRKNKATQELFDLWLAEWLRFKYWDEQKSLYRALEKSKVRMFLLSVGWNSNDKEKAKIIYHSYGECAARNDPTK